MYIQARFDLGQIIKMYSEGIYSTVRHVFIQGVSLVLPPTSGTIYENVQLGDMNAGFGGCCQLSVGYG